MFGGAEGTLVLVSLQQGGGESVIQGAVRHTAPVIYCNCNVIQQDVVTRVVKVDNTGEGVTHKQGIVTK